MTELTILCEHRPSSMKLEIQSVHDWPMLKKEISKFEWSYTQTGICYFLCDKVIVTSQGGKPQEVRSR